MLLAYLDSGSHRVLGQIRALNPNPGEMVWEAVQVRRGPENGAPWWDISAPAGEEITLPTT